MKFGLIHARLYGDDDASEEEEEYMDEGDTHENCMKELIDYIQNQAKK